jgi:dienelactone hydrolase
MMTATRTAVLLTVLGATLLVAGCAVARPPFPAEPKAGTAFHSFRQPAGPGPFPAVVLLHTCGGMRTGHTVRWADRLAGQGYAALVVDSFTPRGSPACGVPHFFPATLAQVADDAFAALQHLRQRPDVDARRIGVMGFSYGASAALRTSSARYRRDVGGFQAAVAFYPLCVSPRSDWPPAAQERSNNLYADIEAPTLILMGEADNDTPSVAANCAREVEGLRRAGRPIAITLYPGAGHVFDGGANYHPAAATQATRDMFEFFARHLGRETTAR